MTTASGRAARAAAAFALPALLALPAPPARVAAGAGSTGAPPAAPPPAVAVAEAPADGGQFREHRVLVEGQILDRAFVDVDGDGAEELVVVVAARTAGARGRRELHVHGIVRGGGVDLQPRVVVPVMDDVVAYAFADVREEPGRELVFLTPAGAWSYSTTLTGYRDNIRRLVDAPLFHDVPDPDELPRWRYVLAPTAPGRGERLLLAEPDGYAVWSGPLGAAYEREVRVEADDAGLQFETDGRATVRAGGGGLAFDVNMGGGLLLDEPLAQIELLESEKSTRAPALVDVDGDGRPDLLERARGGLAVHLDRGDGIPVPPTRVEPEPDYLDKNGGSLERTLADLDHDGDIDVLARLSDNSDGLDPRIFRLVVLINDGRRLYPETPDQVLRFEANELRFQLSDIDRDGRMDLVVTKYEMPSLTAVATGFEIRRTQLIYLGRGALPFERQPALRDERTFDLASLETAIVGRYMEEDLSGDGIADLAEIDLDGRIAVRRLQRESGWFGGESWSLDDRPWRDFDVHGSIDNLIVRDVNGDGLGDLITHRGGTLLALMSRRTPERDR